MLFIYKCLTNILFPIIIIVIFIRRIFSKEDAERFKEKLFVSSFKIEKKFKKLIWIHAASLGEVKSVVPLILKLNKKNNYKFLITSVSVSSANFVAKEFKGEKNITHRFFPFDKLNLVKSFLDGWSPDLVIFVDSEIWPNFIFEVKIRKIPLVLLNGRITKKTYKRWMKIKYFSNLVFNRITVAFPQNIETSFFLKKLSTKKIDLIGNLKFAENYDENLPDISKTLKYELKKKNVWIASSTHAKEEVFCIKAHLKIKKRIKNLITIIIPRHIHRTNEIISDIKKFNLKFVRHSSKPKILKDVDFYIVDTFGETKKFHKIASTVFLGGSITNRGGQNPLEAARCGAQILHGPNIDNFKDVYKLLNSLKASKQVNSSDKLASSIKFKKYINVGNKIKIIGEKILKKTIKELNIIINNEIKKT